MISPEVRLILSALAAFRAAELVAIDKGPYEIFEKLRRTLGIRAAESYVEYPGRKTVRTELAELVNCPFCIGIWISTVLTVFNLFPMSIADAVIVVLAIAGAQSFLQQIAGRESQ